jgi:putative phage-type endonuclease
MREQNNLQGTGAWFNQRTGRLTASRVAASMAFLKNGSEASERKKLKIEILCERLTGDIVPKYVTHEMQWGIDKEPAAKEAFEGHTGLIVSDLGWVPHPSIENCGASPDGLCSDGLLIEVKCPSTVTHMTWMLNGVVPEEYKPQMILQAACTGRPAVWFCSFDPRLPEKQQLFIRKFEPTVEEIKFVEEQAIKFLQEVDAMFDQITKEN